MNGKMPTGLVVAGPSNSAALHFQSVVDRINVEERAVLVELSSGQCPNLKTTLKYINQHITSQVVENDEEIILNGKRVASPREQTEKDPLTVSSTTGA